MIRVIVFLCLNLLTAKIFAQPLLVEEKLNRAEGVFSKNSVYIRALAWLPEQKADAVILYFSGWPTIARIESDKTFYVGFNKFILPSKLINENIGIVLMDCPTDQWGIKSPNSPTACDDYYRISDQHVSDVGVVIESLKNSNGLENFYIMGHSHGTISAKYLGEKLKDRIAGVISSAAVTVGYGGSVSRFGWAGGKFNMSELKIPVLNIHHEEDGCSVTPYSTVKSYSNNNLVTVKGGFKNGPVCGGGNYHSYEGNEIGVMNTIIKWIKTKEFTPTLGD